MHVGGEVRPAKGRAPSNSNESYTISWDGGSERGGGQGRYERVVSAKKRGEGEGGFLKTKPYSIKHLLHTAVDYFYPVLCNRGAFVCVCVYSME